MAGAAIALLLIVCAMAARSGPGPVDPESADQNIGRFALEHMAKGDSFYPAMDKALRTVNGPASSGRAFREPLVFEVWHLLSSEEAIWLALVALIAAAGVATALTSNVPLVAPVVAAYLVQTAALDQFLLVEVWTAPLLLLAVAAWRLSWRKTAIVLTIAATWVRELAVLVLVGGLWADRQRAPRPWIVGLVISVVGVLAHFAYAGRFTVPNGSEATLLGTGSPNLMLQMVGVGFTQRQVAALIIWPLAWWQLSKDRDLAKFLGPLLAFPLIGIVIGRPYWGFMFVPVILLLAGESIGDLVSRYRERIL